MSQLEPHLSSGDPVPEVRTLPTDLIQTKGQAQTKGQDQAGGKNASENHSLAGILPNPPSEKALAPAVIDSANPFQASTVSGAYPLVSDWTSDGHSSAPGISRSNEPHHSTEDLPPLVTAGDLAKEAPPWLVSAMIHMLVLIVLGLLFVPTENFSELILRLDHTEKLGDDLQADDLSLSLDQTDIPIDQQILTPQQLEVTDEPLIAPNDTPVVAMPLGGLEDPTAAPIRIALSGREKGMQQALLNAYGGTAATQSAVMEGLRWLARNQGKDGLWSLVGNYRDGARRGAENKEAATAMALIAFQGAGYTTKTNRDDPFFKVVSRGWARLLKQQDEQGNFFLTGPNHARLYTQAMCTIALCELYGMTGDSAYREPAQRAIDYCVKVQSPEGGWRYYPGRDSDTSVTGWFVMALQSARMAGLHVPTETLARVSRFLNLVERDGGRRYAYQEQDIATLSMTAEGLLCRQYLGWDQDDHRLQAGADFLIDNLPNWAQGRSPNHNEGERDVYYWYYAAQVCHHLEGRHWRTWNRVMREVLPANQENKGRERGSWSPKGVRWGDAGGRLTITCLSIYMLEVYYRHLPIYQLDQLQGL